MKLNAARQFIPFTRCYTVRARAAIENLNVSKDVSLCEGYVVKVIFDKESVTRKTVASGMTPDEPFEDTTYSRGEPVG